MGTGRFVGRKIEQWTQAEKERETLPAKQERVR